MISDFRYKVYEKCALLGYYAAYRGNLLPTFRDNLSIPSSRVQIGPIGCPETLIINNPYSLCNDPEERSSQGHMKQCLITSGYRVEL